MRFVENNSITAEQEEFFPESNKLENAEVCLELRNIRKYYPVQAKSIVFSKNIGYVKAVDGVDLQLYKGETLGIVGESGCGKSTLAKVMINLEEPTTGEAYYRDINIHKVETRVEELKFRRKMQLIFQDPYSSLNPRMLIRDILREPLKIHFPSLSKVQQDQKIVELLNTVGLEGYHALRYPHEFSGGQRQRLGIARALIMEPEIILADEPVSALDVSVQASVLNLMQDLQEAFGLTIVFIAHDLSVIKHVSNRVAVMYLGRIVELAGTEDIFNQPAHPYTVALLSAIPFADPDITKDRIILEGDVPSPINIPDGCRFAPRCYKVQDRCKKEDPIIELKRPGQYVACHFPEDKGVIEF
ncbi:MAG: ATP-binding cassette domain-containing protein [Candidatus Heimdallarchaeota archaeon]|nr:ATP-binding cassette domain-containing protein [Candidatus Heimdallarchaeota archaeon]